jgi:hypothetical protein
MYGNDWLLRKGDRIGVLVTTANADWWTPTPSGSTVTVKSGSITLPFLAHQRTHHIRGKLPTRLAQWLGDAPFSLSSSTVKSSTSASFVLPPPERR